MNNKKTFKLIVSDSSTTSSIEEEKIKLKKNDKNKKNVRKIKKLLTNYIKEDNKKNNIKDDSYPIFNLCLVPKKKENKEELSVSDSDLIEFINN